MMAFLHNEPPVPPDSNKPQPVEPTVGRGRATARTWRAGDRAARDLLLAQIHPVLYRWALANATDTNDADDIAQQALVAVHRKIGQFRGESPFAVWLYRLTTRTAAQRRRTLHSAEIARMRARKRMSTRRVYETDPGGRVDRDRLTALVRECYDRLPPQQRAALSLVDLEGYTPAEAAELMELTPGDSSRQSLQGARERKATGFLSLAGARRALCARCGTGAGCGSRHEPRHRATASRSLPEEIRKLEQSGINGEQLEPVLREAAALCVESQSALASSLTAMERPRTRTSVVLARRGRRWRWRLLLVFVPMIVIGLLLFGTAIAALVTAFFWR